MRILRYTIDGREFVFDVDGQTSFGDDRILLSEEDDLSRDAPWHGKGFSVDTLFDDKTFYLLLIGIQSEIKRRLEVIIGNAIPDFTLEQYHLFCKNSMVHSRLLEGMKYCLPIEAFPINWNLIDERISEICRLDVTAKHSKKVASSRFCVRLVRPNVTTDNNPPHRDAWLDRLKGAINIYVPLAGSDENSSLSLIPGSHFWSEKDIERTIEGAIINGLAYTVPCAVSAKSGLNFIRPKVRPNEVLVFSPYLIHGGAVNLNSDRTRASLEMRFWRKE